MSFEPLNFEPIKDEERSVLGSDAELDILAMFEAAVNSSSSPEIDAAAKLFVNDLVAFAPEAISGLNADCIARATWEVLINAACCIPCRHWAQDILVKIVGLLSDAGDPWKDFPGFWIVMRESWNRDPVFDGLYQDDDINQDFTWEEWVNVNSFVAKLEKQFLGFGLWALRSGLEGAVEEEKHTPEAVANIRILVATEWIIYDGRALLQESLLNGLSHEPTSGQPWRGGPLFPGTRGFNLERWGFWKRRLGELRESAVDSTQKKIDEAVELMKVTEAEAAKAWGV